MGRVGRWSALTAVWALVVAGVATPEAGAATPSSGAVGPASPTASWTGPVQTSVAPNGPADCAGAPGAFCDSYALTVNVPPSYWATHSGGVNVAISWPSPDDDFDLYVYRGMEEVTHSGGSATTSEQAFVPTASGLYQVLVVYYAVTASGYDGGATFQTAAGGGGAAFTTRDVRFG